MKTNINLGKLWEYQKEILEYLNQPDVKYVSFVKSRQSGGSYLMKSLVGYWALREPNQKIGYITPTYKLGKEFYKQIVDKFSDFVVYTDTQQLKIEFASGSSVQFFSAEAADAIRGFQFHYVVLDEAAYMDTDTFNLIIRPTWTVLGKKIVLCSTPNGNNGFFYEFVMKGLNFEDRYRAKVITIYDNPIVDPFEVEEIKMSMPDKAWRQEYLAEFLDGSGSVFSNFKNCIGDYDPRHRRYYAAIDWGKQADYTVLTIMNDHREVVDILRFNQIDYTAQIKLVVDRLNVYKPVVVISEENNMGVVINELLKKSYRGKIKQITLDNKLKQEIIESLVVAFEQGEIRIPDDPALMRELQAFSVSYNTATRTLKYSAPRGLHDDMVLSLAYCYYACRNRSGKYYIF